MPFLIEQCKKALDGSINFGDNENKQCIERLMRQLIHCICSLCRIIYQCQETDVLYIEKKLCTASFLLFDLKINIISNHVLSVDTKWFPIFKINSYVTNYLGCNTSYKFSKQTRYKSTNKNHFSCKITI